MVYKNRGVVVRACNYISRTNKDTMVFKILIFLIMCLLNTCFVLTVLGLILELNIFFTMNDYVARAMIVLVAVFGVLALIDWLV